MEGDVTNAGYRFVTSQDLARRATFADQITAQYGKLDDVLSWHAPGRDFLFDALGLAECVSTPMVARFWFLEHYGDYDIPDTLPRGKHAPATDGQLGLRTD